MKTGIFYNEILSQHSWSIILSKLKNFPELIKGLSRNPNVVLFQMEPVSEELLLKVHTKEMMERVKLDINYIAGIYSAGGCVMAAEKVWTGEIRNAFLALSCCHHAGPDYYWGGCTVSGTGPMVVNMRQQYGQVRFAILDTDAHHGDGARALFRGDRDVLHVCFCSTNRIEDEGTKVDVDVGWKTTDEAYLNQVRTEFIPRAIEFKPDIIFHMLGHDTAQGDYGDRGLSWDFFAQLVKEVKQCADRICGGKYIVGLGGGARWEVADYITPRIVEVLSEV